MNLNFETLEKLAFPNEKNDNMGHPTQTKKIKNGFSSNLVYQEKKKKFLMIEQYLHVYEKCTILVSNKNDALFVSSTSHFQIQIQ
jgi:hypothetical protein